MWMARSCAVAFTLCIAAPGRAQAPSPASAFDAEALKKSCDKGSAADCLTLAVALQRGEGVPRDLSRAAGFHKKACEGGQAVGCFELAAMHVDGQGASKDVGRAVTLFQKACDLKHADGCIRLARLFYEGKDVPKELGR